LIIKSFQRKAGGEPAVLCGKLNGSFMSKRPPTTEPSDPLQKDPKSPADIFPHYTRLFSASLLPTVLRRSGKIILWAILALCIAVNVIILQPEATSLPFLGIGESQENDVLGTSDLAEKTQHNESLADAYGYWTEIIHDHPDYRDAHFQAAIIAYKLGRREDSQNHLNKVRELDPNYPGTTPLQNLLGK